MKTCSWGHPALTQKMVESIAENMIPIALRPYYVGCDVMKENIDEPYTEWNSNIMLLFKYPVVSDAVGDSRYAHGSLYNIKEELESMYLDEDSDTEDYAEYDEEYNDRPVKPIKPMAKDVVSHKPGYDGEN